MKRPYSSLFSYYGGKSKLAEYYPAPIGDLVIEPFCGGASYSLLHCERQVIINDKDDVTASIWRFLLRPDSLALVQQHVPETVVAGTKVSDWFDRSINEGLYHLLRASASQGCMGERGTRTVVTPWAARDWHQELPCLRYWIPKIAHWQLLLGDYSDIPNQSATWFIDPPYNNVAGSTYRTNDVNFQHLAQWSRERLGQVIVCENKGADWLPFKPLRQRTGSFSGRDAVTKADGGEVVWIHGDEGLLTFEDWA